MSKKKKKKGKGKPRQAIHESMRPIKPRDDAPEVIHEEEEIRQRPPQPQQKGMGFRLQRWLGILSIKKYLKERLLRRVEELHEKIDRQSALIGLVREQGHQYEDRHLEAMKALNEHKFVLNQVLEQISGLREEMAQYSMSTGTSQFTAQSSRDTFDRNAPFDSGSGVAVGSSASTTENRWSQGSGATPQHQRGVGRVQKPSRKAAASRRRKTKESAKALQDLARSLQPWIKQLSLSNSDLEPIAGEMAEQLGTEIEQLPLGGHSSDDWEVMILRPHSWSRGLAVAGPGVQVDSDTVRLFDAEFGMRVKSCLEPAILTVENDDKYEVVQKGKVKTER